MNIEQSIRLEGAILSAFSREELGACVVRGLGVELEHVVAAGPLASEVQALISWAVRAGRCLDLFYAIRDDRPHNPRIQEVVAELVSPGGRDGATSDSHREATSNPKLPASGPMVGVTFDDLYRVSITSVRAASDTLDRAEPGLDFHPKVRGAVNEIGEMRAELDRRIRLFAPGTDEPSRERADVCRHEFLDAVETHLPDMEDVSRRWQTLCGLLRGVRGSLRRDAMLGFAGFAALRMLYFIEQFRYFLIDREGRLVMRPFAEVGMIRKRSIHIFPARDEIALRALGSARGYSPEFVRCLFGPEYNRGEYVALPRQLAEDLANTPAVSADTYYAWVLPQWLLMYGDPPPAEKLRLKDR